MKHLRPGLAAGLLFTTTVAMTTWYDDYDHGPTTARCGMAGDRRQRAGKTQIV